MESVLSFRKLFIQLKKLFWVWLALAVLGGIAALLITYAMNEDRGHVSQVVSYSYDGIESGNDPVGNRFDPAEIKEEAMVRAAVKAAELEEEELDLSAIQDAIIISGIVPDGILDTITAPKALDEKDEKGETSSAEEIRVQSYIPTQYTVSLDYASLGLSGEQGSALLEQLLNCYASSFYDNYGVSGVDKAVRAMDYRDYDYGDAVRVLDAKLSILRSFLSQQAKLDNSRFTSRETGYTFSDLVEAVDMIRNEDLNRITSYVSTFNLTKDRTERINFYRYKIENEGRIQAQIQERLNALDSLISGYQKTTAVVSGYVGDASSGGGGESLLSYEVTQPSKTYDDLVTRKIDSRTALSGSVERISSYQTRLEQLESGESQGSVQLVEEILENSDRKIDELLTKTSQTTSEFYETVYLKRAFQVVPSSDGFQCGVRFAISNAMNKAVGMEAFLFGLYLLCAVALAMLANRNITSSRLELFLKRTSPRTWRKRNAGKTGEKRNDVRKGR